MVGLRQVPWLRRNTDRLRPLDEAAAYARCHGSATRASASCTSLPAGGATTISRYRRGIRRRFEELIERARSRALEEPVVPLDGARRRLSSSTRTASAGPAAPLESCGHGPFV